MTALLMERASHIERWTHHSFQLAVGTKAFKGGLCVLDTTTGKVKPGAAGTSFLYIGKFDETVDATLAEKPVSVDLGVEIEVVWWNNDTVAPVTAVMLGLGAFVVDDQTVSSVATGRSMAGRIWAVDALYGVAVQKLSQPAGAPVVEDGGAARDAGRDDADTPTPPHPPSSFKPNAPPSASRK